MNIFITAAILSAFTAATLAICWYAKGERIIEIWQRGGRTIRQEMIETGIGIAFLTMLCLICAFAHIVGAWQ